MSQNIVSTSFRSRREVVQEIDPGMEHFQTYWAVAILNIVSNLVFDIVGPILMQPHGGKTGEAGIAQLTFHL